MRKKTQQEGKAVPLSVLRQCKSTVVYGYNSLVPASRRELIWQDDLENMMQEAPWHIAALHNMLMVKRGDKTPSRPLGIPRTRGTALGL